MEKLMQATMSSAADDAAVQEKVAARTKNTQAVLSMVLELLWKNRFAYKTVAEQLRAAASTTTTLAAADGGAAVKMLTADNEKLHREMDIAQKALDDLHVRLRSLSAAHSQLEDTLRTLHADNEALRGENAHLQELADTAKRAAAKATLEAAEQAEQQQLQLASVASPPPVTVSPQPPLTPQTSLPALVMSPQLPLKKMLLQQRAAPPAAAVALPPAAAAAMPLQQPLAPSSSSAVVVATSAQTQQLEERISGLAKQIEELSSDRDAGRMECARLQSELDNLTEARVQASPHWKLLHDRCDALASALTAERQRAASFESDLASERARRAPLETELAARRQDVDNLQEQLKVVVAERDRFFEQRKAIEVKLTDPSLQPSGTVQLEATQLVQHQQQLCSRLKAENAKLSQQLSSLSVSRPTSTTPPPPPPSVSKEELEVKLKRQLEELRARETELVAEIGSISQAYEETVDQNSRLTAELAKHEDTALVMAKEKIRLELAIRAANDERDQMKLALGEALKRAQGQSSETQTRETRMRELTTQLQSALEDTRIASAMANEARQTAADAQLALTGLTSQAETFKGLAEVRARELAVCVADREKERLDRLAAEKALVALQRAAASAGADSEEVKRLEQKLEEFRNKFRCPLCSDREKNTLIRRCSHVFCDVCIQKSLKSRQRKCPACLQPYGESDVIKFWL